MSESRPPTLSPGTPIINRPRVVRRRYLIDPKRQLRTAIMTTSLTAALLVAVNIGFEVLRSSQTTFLAAAAPRLIPLLEEQGTVFSVAMIIISIAIVVAVALTTVVHTHRTAGAVYAVRQRFERVEAGDLQVTMKLRQRDNLQDLEAPFNRMIRALRERTLNEAAALEDLAGRAARIGPDGDELAVALRTLAQHKRQVGT